MFQSIRPNSQIYIFHKGDPMRVDNGIVINQPVPKPKYSVTPAFGQPQEMIVDLTVKVNNETLNFNAIPAQADIADSFSNGENIVISASREAINAEVLNEKQKSIDIVKSKEYHEKRIESCDTLLGQLYPEYAEKKVQKEELNELKVRMDNISLQVDRLVEALMSKNTRTNE